MFNGLAPFEYYIMLKHTLIYRLDINYSKIVECCHWLGLENIRCIN